MTGKADFTGEEWETVLHGPPAAGLYAGLMIWVLLRERRGARSAAGSGRPRPTGVAGRAPAGSSSRR